MFYSPEWFSKSYRHANLRFGSPFFSIYFLKDSLSIRGAVKSVSYCQQRGTSGLKNLEKREFEHCGKPVCGPSKNVHKRGRLRTSFDTRFAISDLLTKLRKEI